MAFQVGGIYVEGAIQGHCEGRIRVKYPKIRKTLGGYWAEEEKYNLNLFCILIFR